MIDRARTEKGEFTEGGIRAMTLSADARITNLNEALVAFLNALGEEQFSYFYIMRTDYPSVLDTTWTELTRRGWLKDANINLRCYQFTPFGYIQALKISKRSEEPQFRERLGSICKVLKGSLKGRADFEFIAFQDLVKESGVSAAFAQNVLDADLIWHVLGRMGAEWEGEHLVRVPHDFGLTPI
jgi:hypothetical protein